MVTVTALTLTQASKYLLSNVSCILTPGHITSFIGPSGAGKTTLLKTIAGLRTPTSGSITLDGKSLAACAQERAQQVGFVFQDFNLFRHLTVLQNCMDPLLVAGKTEQEAQERATQELARLGMSEHHHKYPHELSGGQQQRVAIARALCLSPQVLLLDEPTASLDPVNSTLLATILRSLAQQGLTIGVSTQDMGFLKLIFDRVYYLQKHIITEFCENKEELDPHSAIKAFMQAS